MNTLRQSERRLWEAEQRVTHEKLLESSSNNGALQAKVEMLEKEIRALEQSVNNKEQELEMEKEKSKELDGIKQELEKEKEKSKELDGIKQELKEEKESLKQLKTTEEELKEERLKLKQRLESTELELKNEREKLKQHLENTELQLEEEKEKLKQYLESTELQLKEQVSCIMLTKPLTMKCMDFISRSEVERQIMVTGNFLFVLQTFKQFVPIIFNMYVLVI